MVTHKKSDLLYKRLHELLDIYYPERTVTITSSDPPFVTPVVKQLLRRKNVLMRSGKVEKVAALSIKMGTPLRSITLQSSVTLMCCLTPRTFGLKCVS